MRDVSEWGHIRWFLKELPRLKTQGKIRPETLDVLEVYYTERLQAQSVGRRRFVMYLLLIAAFLLGVFVLYRLWPHLPWLIQVIVTLLPLLTGAYFGVYSIWKDNPKFKEWSSVLLVAGLLFITYEMNMRYNSIFILPDYLRYMLLFLMSLTFIFNSVWAGLMLCCGCMILAVHTWSPYTWGTDSPEMTIFSCIIILIPVLYSLPKLHNSLDNGPGLLIRYGFIPLTIAMKLLPLTNQFPVYFLIGILMYEGYQQNKKGIPVLRNPLLLFAPVSAILLLTFGGNLAAFWRISFAEAIMPLEYNILTVAVIIIITVYFIATYRKSPKADIVAILLFASVPLSIYYSVFAAKFTSLIFLFLFGIHFIVKWYLYRESFLLNIGLLNIFIAAFSMSSGIYSRVLFVLWCISLIICNTLHILLKKREGARS